MVQLLTVPPSFIDEVVLLELVEIRPEFGRDKKCLDIWVRKGDFLEDSR